MARRIVVLFTLLLFGASLAFGQRDGIPNFSAADSYEFDTVNLSTLVPTFHFPVLSKVAGAMPGSVVMAATQNCHTGIVAHTFVCGAGQVNAAIPTTILQEMLTQMTVGYSSVNNSGCITFTIFSLLGVDGVTSYKLPSTNLYSPSTCGVQSATITTNDGTGYTVTISSSTGAPEITSLYNSSGWSASYPNGTSSTVTDPFSNTLNLSGTTFTNNGVFTDSLGAITDFNGSTYAYQYTDANGSTQDITFTNGTSVNYFPLNACDNTHGSGTMTPVTSINYPDGTSIALGWETHGTGDSGQINSITLRTGGQISYTYTNGGSCTAWYNTALTRTTPDGTWNYSLTTSSGTTTTTVLDPGKNKTVYVFGGGNLSAGNPSTFIESIDRYQNTGTVASPSYTHISETLYCYNTSSNPCTNTPAYAITQRDVYEYVYTSGGTQVQMSHDEQTYDSYGDVLTDANTDSINSQTITKTIVYGNLSGGSCVALGNTHVVDHPCTVTTTNGSTWLSESTYSYNSNGALTSSSICLSSTCTGSSALTTTYTPTTQGTYSAIQAPNGQTTNYTYGSCNSLVPTDITTTVNSIAIDNKETWNCNAAVVTDTTDPNSNEDDYTYDSMNRISTYHDRMGDTNTTSYAYGTPTLDHVKVTDNIGVVSYQYNDGLGRPTNHQICQTSGCSNLDTSSKAYAWNGTNFETTTYAPCVKTTLNSACTTVALTSDVNPIAGPTKSTDANSGTLTYAVNSKDFSVTAGPAPSGENTKVLQTEIDGFGRTTSTCALQASGGTTCGQTMGNSGILTSNVYSFATGAPKVVTTRGSQSHTTIADAVGRTTSVQTPEAGTVTYLYDSDQSSDGCGNRTASGDLLKITKASGNYECHITDGLHRVTDRANNVTGSGCQRWRYDSTANKYQSAPTGYPSSGNNLIGRLMEAETDSCNSTAVTDEWFAYDKMGRVTDMWESTPNSGGYYHTTVAYDADGVVTSLTSPFSTVTYGNLDGEDRPTSMTYGSTTIVSATAGSGFTYDAASRPTNIPIGTAGNQDAFTWDNVGNMLTYTFNVGTKADGGTLTWNSIGSLGKLVINDTIASSTDSQSCAYGYDDVARLTGITSPSGSTCNATETYAYDQYDNLWQSGAFSYACSTCYSSSTNEQTGTPTLTYDSDGNTTNDGSNTYTWNAHGLIASARAGSFAAVCGTSGTCNTYDALGNLVEQVTGSTNQQLLYSPIGQIGVMNGQTTSYAHIPAPGRGYLFVVGTTPYFDHVDWLGTERLVNTVSGSTIDNDQAYTPYGQEYNTLGSSFDLFTGDIKALAGLWHTPNRELLQTGARWLSPDPAHAGWNAYAYPTDPNTQTDPSGLGDDLCAGCVVWNGMTIKPGGCAFTPKDSFCNSGEGVQSQEVNQEGTEIPRPGPERTFEGGFWGVGGVTGTDAFAHMVGGNGGIVLGLLNRTSWGKWWQETGCQAGQMCQGAVTPVGGGEWEAPTFEIAQPSEDVLRAVRGFVKEHPEYANAKCGDCGRATGQFLQYGMNRGIYFAWQNVNRGEGGPLFQQITNPMFNYTVVYGREGLVHAVNLTPDKVWVIDMSAMQFLEDGHPEVSYPMIFPVNPANLFK